MFNPSREQVRQFFIDAWHKHLAPGSAGVLTPMELMAVELIGLHPEYHDVMTERESALSRDYLPESGETNPFLHLSLHLAVEEQLSIDQPPGIRAAFEAQLARLGDRHAAVHVVLECLGETIWRSQRDGTPLDASAYLECVRGQRRK